MSISPSVNATDDDPIRLRCPGCLAEKRQGVIAELRPQNRLLSVHQAVRPRDALHVADVEIVCRRHDMPLVVQHVLSLGEGVVERAAESSGDLLPLECDTCGHKLAEIRRHHPLLRIALGRRSRGALRVAYVDIACPDCQGDIVEFNFSLAVTNRIKKLDKPEKVG